MINLCHHRSFYIEFSMNMTLMYLGKALAFGQKERNYMYLDGQIR